MKKIPIGYEDFKEVIDKNLYFVDKSEFIKDIIDNEIKIGLFTRPRRFGKTLNMSMVKYFFEKTNEDNSYLFKSLKIVSYGDKYMKYQGQYPVVFLTLKDMKQGNFEDSFDVFKNIISDEFSRHDFLLNSDKISETEKIRFKKIVDMKAENSEYLLVIKFLVSLLYKYYNKKVIVLIDEYDVPLQDGWVNNKDNYYNKIRDLIRSLFSSALKSNPSLEFAILTGSMRIAKEEIFTGLNNFVVYSILNNEFSSYFGFTKDEVLQIAKDYDIDKKSLSEMQRWYDGYTFGNTDIFNPWSILTCISRIKGGDKNPFQAFWANTSGNDIVRTLIERSNINEKSQIEQLIASETISKRIYEEMTFGELDKNPDYIWTMLFLTGYLTQINDVVDENKYYYDLKIPNVEVLTIFQDTIQHWFDEKIESSHNEVLKSALSGDAFELQKSINKYLRASISYMDDKEAFYHGMLLGLLSGDDNFDVKSNRENGDGRSDITVASSNFDVAIIFELKYTKEPRQLQKICNNALNQIEEMHYDEEFKEIGYEKILKYGICFCGKVCMVKRKEE